MKKIIFIFVTLISFAFMQDECSDLTQDECSLADWCQWDNAEGVCYRIDDWDGSDNYWEDPCHEFEAEDECLTVEGCIWLIDPSGEGVCFSSWDSECYGLEYEDCAYLDFCEWITDNDDGTSNGYCIGVGDNWYDCNPDLACATVITCYEGLLYPTSCGPENCDEPIGGCDDYMEGCHSDNGGWYDIGQEMLVNDCEYYECTENGWVGPFTLDNENCSDNNDFECSDLSQDECQWSDDCEWISDSDNPNSWGSCVEIGDDNDWECSDLGYEDCLDVDYCDWVSSSYDPNNWGYCVEIDNENDGPPECLEDCEGIQDIEPSENPYEACDWIISNFGANNFFNECAEDCDEETMMEINEVVEACYECLQNEDIDCADIFDNNNGICEDLDYEQCMQSQYCEANYNSNGEFVGCEEYYYSCNDLNQEECTMSEDCEWVSITTPNGIYETCVESDGWINDPCENLFYEECIDNPECEWHWSMPGDYGYCYELEYGVLFGTVSYIYGDVVDFVPGAPIYILSLPSSSNMYVFETIANGEGFYEILLPTGAYEVTAYANEESQTQTIQINSDTENELNFLLGDWYGPWYPFANLELGSSQATPGSDIIVPLYLSATELVGGVQFTIASDSPTTMAEMLVPSGIESIDPCFTADFNNVEDQFLGIIFSMEGCSYPAEEMLHIADLEYNINDDAPLGSYIELFFNTTIVSDPIGNEIPSVGNGTTILIGNQGDINADGELNVLDIVLMVNFAIFILEPTDAEFWTSDLNNDNAINVLDIVLLVNLILNN